MDRHDHDALDVAVRSADPSAARIWQVGLPEFKDPHRIASLPVGAFPNGTTFDPAGDLFVADSDLGQIWRLPVRSSTPTVWAHASSLAPTGASFENFPLPGANGIKVRDGVVYVSNTSTATILTIPIQRNGSAGPIRAKFTNVEADDFAFAANGDLYAAENPESKLVRISPSGHVVTLATKASGLENTSAVAFDVRPHHRNRLYVTNSAYFGTRPSLQALTVSSVGQALP